MKMLLNSTIRLPTASNSPNPVFSCFFKIHIPFFFFILGNDMRDRIRNAEEKFHFWIFVCLAFSLDFILDFELYIFFYPFLFEDLNSVILDLTAGKPFLDLS